MSSRWLGLESMWVTFFSDSIRVQHEKWFDLSQNTQMTQLRLDLLMYALNDSTSQFSCNLLRINSFYLRARTCKKRVTRKQPWVKRMDTAWLPKCWNVDAKMKYVIKLQ